MTTRVFLSLGLNLGDRRAGLDRMEAALANVLTAPVSRSRVMETEPVGVDEEQPWYVNRIVSGGYAGPAQELLRQCLSIEADLGRTRHRRRGSRVADIDILLFGDACVRSAGLEIPHPEMLNRRFCLEGLNDLAPDLMVPGIGMTVSECLRSMSTSVRSQNVQFLTERE